MTRKRMLRQRLARVGILAISLALPILSITASAQPASAPTPQSPATSTRPLSQPQLQNHSAAETRRAHQVLLDVVVTNPAGTPISGLHASDFELFDNQTPATISNFQSVPGASATADAHVQTLLVIDAINTSHQNLTRSEDQVRSFLRKDGGHLQQTISLLILSDSAPSIKTDASGSSASTVTALRDRQAFIRRVPPSQDGLALVKALDQSVVGLSRILEAQGGEGESEKVRLSLQALNAMATALTQQPGRKIVIWLSPGWPLLAHTNAKTKEALFDSIVYFSNLLRDARITLDFINPAGVEGLHNQVGLAPAGTVNGTAIRGGPTPVPTSSAGPTFYENFFKGVPTAKQTDVKDLALQVLAHQTGGLVLSSDSRIEPEIARCVAEAGAFYTLTFDLPATTGTERYHQLEVKVHKPEATARARLGYYTRYIAP